MSKKQFYDYTGREIVVRYEPRRCIHAAECIRNAPGVFERDRRPWILPDEGPADLIARAVVRCPTGALHFERRDGGEPEAESDRNRARVAPDGPLYIEGRLLLLLPDGSRRRESRAALCRCGASQNKPFCDNSHQQVGFADGGELGAPMLVPAVGDESSQLEVSTIPNGPIRVMGPLQIEGATVGEPQNGVKGSLCRCGASRNKPYCDGSHGAIGFAD